MVPAQAETQGIYGSASLRAAAEAAGGAAAASGGPPPVVGLYAPVLRVEAGTDAPLARFAVRDGAHDHLRVVAGGARDGLWVPQRFADLYGVAPGDRLGLPGVELPPVTAVYAPPDEPLDAWWCSEQRYVTRSLSGGEAGAALPVWLPDRQALYDLVDAGGTPPDEALEYPAEGAGAITLRFPEPLPATPSAAAAFAGRTEALRDELAARLSGAGVAIAVADSAVRPLERAAEGARTVRTALLPLTAASLLVGLAGTAAVAVQWAQRRAGEVRLLWMRGQGPALLGVRAVAELGWAVLLGAVAGAVAARGALPLVAPTTELEPGTTARTAGLVALAVVVQLAVLGVVAAQRVRAAHEALATAGGVGLRLAGAPWELVAVVLAAGAWLRLREGALTAVRGEVVPDVDPVALAFPLLAVIAAAGVAARLVLLGLGAAHRVRAWWWPAGQLALRRLSAGRRTVAAVVAVAALAVGGVAVGTGVAGAQRDALLVKSDLLTGARTNVAVSPDTAGAPLPGPLRGAATPVGRLLTVVDGEEYAVLVVDPATIADGVTWRRAFGDAALADVLAPLTGPPVDGAFPALRVGAAPPGTALPISSRVRARDVGAVDAFPGLGTARGGYVLPVAALDGDLALASWGLWSERSREEVVGALTDAGVSAGSVASRDTALDALPFLVVVWTFDLVTALGVALAALAAAALLLAAEVRRRQNALSGSLARRMGLRRRALAASHAVELGAVAGAALVVGAAAGLAATGLAARHLDPAPRLLGAVLAPPPGPFLAVAALLAAAVVALATGVAVRAVSAARVRELVRG